MICFHSHVFSNPRFWAPKDNMNCATACPQISRSLSCNQTDFHVAYSVIDETNFYKRVISAANANVPGTPSAIMATSGVYCSSNSIYSGTVNPLENNAAYPAFHKINNAEYHCTLTKASGGPVCSTTSNAVGLWQLCYCTSSGECP